MRKIKKRGQSLVEYLILITIVSLGFIVGLTYFKDTIANAFNGVADTMNERAH